MLGSSLAACEGGSEAKAPSNPQLDERLKALVEDPERPLSSLAVLVVEDNKIIYEGYFGNRYIDNEDAAKNLPATRDTKFRIASISKVITSIAAMQLVEQGKLDLDKDVSGYLGFQLRNPNFPENAITARMLLTHTSSLRDGEAYSIPLPYALKGFFLPEGKYYEDGGHFAQPEKDFDAAPWKYFSYQNINFGVLATIIEAVSGERFDRYVWSHILTPLEIDGSYNLMDISDKGFAEIATLYRKRDADGSWNTQGPWIPQVDDYHGVRPEQVISVKNPDSNDPAEAQGAFSLEEYQIGSNGTLFSPQGGLRISAPDLSKIMFALINDGKYNGAQILKPESVSMMMSSQWKYDAASNNGDTYYGLMREWGLGVQHITASGTAGDGDRVVASPDIRLWGHLGEAYGLLSGMLFDPEKKIGYIYLIGGVGASPDDNYGSYSSFCSWEEGIQTAIFEEILNK